MSIAMGQLEPQPRYASSVMLMWFLVPCFCQGTIARGQPDRIGGGSEDRIGSADRIRNGTDQLQLQRHSSSCSHIAAIVIIMVIMVIMMIINVITVIGRAY